MGSRAPPWWPSGQDIKLPLLVPGFKPVGELRSHARHGLKQKIESRLVVARGCDKEKGE